MAESHVTKHRLRFLFVGYWRDWNPVEGFTPPKGRVCELRSLPGNVVTWASTPQEAYLKMRMALGRAFAHSGSPTKWYGEATAAMTQEDERERKNLWERVWTEGCRTTLEELSKDDKGGTRLAAEVEVPVEVEFVTFVREKDDEDTLVFDRGSLVPC